MAKQDSEKLNRGWDAVKSPKEHETKDGTYKGGAAQSQPAKPPKVD